ncbi:MAG: sialidase family protein [Bryobacteraceae bacterium]
MLRRSFLTAAALAPTARPAEPKLEKIDVFTANSEGYPLYRIPGIVVTAKGTILAYCEARKTLRGDWGSIDIVMRRSTDGGTTWSPQRIIAQVPGPLSKNPMAQAQGLGAGDGITYNNPVAIVDPRRGTVHFLFCIEYMRAFYMRSDDDGVTFSAPVEITKTFEAFRPDYPWKVLATGPAHGIMTSRGRMIVPVWLSTGTGGHAHRPSVASLIYSDDRGKTWKRGDIAFPDTPEQVIPNETIVAELADGRVMLNARSESKAHRRLVSTSPNGATHWSKPEFHQELLEPICMASMVRLSTVKSHGKNRLLFANPHNLDRADGKAEAGKSRDRRNVSVKMSYDEGLTWPVNRAIEPGPSGYSDIAATRDGTILLLYERGRGDALTLARFNVEWLTEGKDSIR